jgi:cytoskeletal protein RodZ
MVPVGQRLAQERIKKGLSIDEVAKATKIQKKFILALERGEYKKLPSSAYIQGFIKNYAEFLNLPKREILALFRREFDEREFLEVLPESFAKGRKKAFSGFRLHTTTLLIILGLLFIVGFIVFAYRATFFDPQLTITSPADNIQVTTQSILIQGRTDPDTSLTVNDDPVSLDKDGKFKKQITVFTGSNTITIKAVNKFGKKTVLIRHVVGK